MSLAEVLEGKFRGDIRFRGAAYVQAERVAITRVTAEKIFAVVRDGVEFQTQLTRHDDDGLRMHCSCATGNQEIRCKHLWATVLATDDGGYVTGSPKPGYIPPFLVESEPISFDALDEWDDDFTTDVVSIPVARRATKTPPKPKLRDWEQQLVDLRKTMDVVKSETEAAARDREIFFEVDVEQSRTDRQLVVEVSQRQRRSNGQWGKLKPLNIRVGRLDEVEHEDDRRILAYITGGTPERTNWYAQQAEYQAAVNRFQLPYELCELVLPMMSATGRFRLQGDDSKTPIEWDHGEPWEFLMRLAEDGDEWKLDGVLRREGEEIPAKAAQLVIPGGLVFTSGRVARLDHFGGDEWIESVLKSDPLSVPSGEEVELVDKLLDMPALPRLELPPNLQLEEVQPDPEFLLTIHSPNGPRWQHERLRGEIHFDYLGSLVRGTSPQTAIVQREQGRCILRNRKQEDSAWNTLQSNGFRRLLDRRRGNHDIEISARDLGPAVRLLINNGWLVRAEGQKVHQPSEMKFRIESGIDWFELHADIDFEGRSISFPELLSALARGDSTIRLDDGSLGIIPEEWLQQYGLLGGLGAQEEDHLRFATNQAGLLDALLQSQEVVEVDDKFRDLCDRLESFNGVIEVEEPDEFKGELRPYQREGLGWLTFLEDFSFGGCLADDMGLGKTVQVLALLEARYAEAGNGQKLPPTLIVVPKSLLFNWLQEIDRFTPSLQALDYTGLERAKLRDEFNRFQVILTTYGTLRRDIMALKDYRFDRVVLDEAQTIKNAGSQVAKASRLLQSEHRIALSGTPIENHLGDLWSIFEFLNPGMLGRSSAFKLYASDSTDAESRSMLARALRPFILRRTKGQVANDLPEKFEQTIYCDMGEEQEQQYKEMRDHYRDSLLGLVQQQGLAKSKMHVLEALLRLRQVACHPGLIDAEQRAQSSAKLDVLCRHLEELIQEGHKSLVFSQFTSMLSIVKENLDKRGIDYEYLDGQTRNRQAVVERFQESDDCHVFLISLKAGGLGLNLTAADYVFLLDPWWNPAVEAQAIDRAHRVGQTKQVFAYRLICRNTVEEKITDLQGKKRDLADAILEENSSLMRDLSSDDLNMLLS